MDRIHNIQARKKNSRVIEIIELPQDVVPMLRLITLSKEPRIDLVKHKQDIFDYLEGVSLNGAPLVVKILKRYESVELVKF